VSDFNDPAFFGDHWAKVYDGDGWDEPPEADLLQEWAAGGRVLELAIGTGRVGVPLKARGVAVEGIEGSSAMVEVMRTKPYGDTIPVVIGDIADVGVDGPYRLVYLVFNTLFNLTTADRQAECFRNVARVLEPGGAFVVDCFVPDVSKFDRGQRVEGVGVTPSSATIQVYQHDALAQRYNKQTITFTAGRVELLPVSLRYSWPSEIDLMARLAGLELTERYGGWRREAFTADSTRHVSVFRTPS
jgi:SAM-dependent methyltransferase